MTNEEIQKTITDVLVADFECDREKITLDTNLEVGDKRNDFFGNALVQERITVDLTPDVPVVTDIRLSQELR